LFTRKPLDTIATIAADTSSRTSNALLRILCTERFGISPEFRPMLPYADRMLTECDAALIIGDPALFLDPVDLASRLSGPGGPDSGIQKIDLGEQWTAMTGLPFVWAFWAGRPDAIDAAGIEALQEARDQGVANADAIGRAYAGPGRAEQCSRYLRDNIKYRLGDRETRGLRRYFELAGRHGVVDESRALQFYHSPVASGFSRKTSA